MKLEENGIWAPPMLPGLSQLYSEKYNMTYSEFREKLRTPFKVVQLSLFTNWLAILIVVIATSFSSNLFSLFFLCVILSLLLHRVLIIIHEGAHYLLAEDKKINDTLSNLTAGWFVFTDIKAYRTSHIQHHRALGTENDPENSHAEMLDLSWLASAISGFKTLSAVTRRIKSKDRSKNDLSNFSVIPVVGILLQGIIVVLIWRYLGLISLVVWVTCLIVIAPTLGMLRNLLEHRYVEAVDPILWEIFLDNSGKAINVNQITTRTFTKSVFSKLYGSMGFTRHLLHHWDPSISYLNLKKIHDFLLSSSVGELIKKTDTTYTKTFFYLFGR